MSKIVKHSFGMSVGGITYSYDIYEDGSVKVTKEYIVKQ